MQQAIIRPPPSGSDYRSAPFTGGGIGMAAITISLATGTPTEMRVRDQLLGLIGRHDLSSWRYTDQVRIEDGAISHSHPVLTLNTRSIEDDALLLATYIHEQLHWWASRSDLTEIEREWRRRYPDVPVGFPEGCRTEKSNYLHFTVCYFEYAGLIALIGPEEARRAMEYSAQRPFYRSIYRTVLSDFPPMSAVVENSGLRL
jgi:hypothetical protein